MSSIHLRFSFLSLLSTSITINPRYSAQEILSMDWCSTHNLCSGMP